MYWHKIGPFWSFGCNVKNENMKLQAIITLNDGTRVSSQSFEYLQNWIKASDKNMAYLTQHYPSLATCINPIVHLTGREFSRLWTFAISKEEFKVPPQPPKESTVEKHMLESKLAFINHLSDPAIEILQYSIGVERMDITTIMDSYRNLKVTGVQEITLTIKDNRK